MKHKLFLFFGILIISLCVGCSDHVGFTGKVVYSDTGEPVPMGEVQLYTPTFVARATIRPDGTFVTGSYGESDGLPPGTYGVAIISIDAEENPLIHPRYADQRTSGLSLTITETTRGFVFEVDRAPPSSDR